MPQIDLPERVAEVWNNGVTQLHQHQYRCSSVREASAVWTMPRHLGIAIASMLWDDWRNEVYTARITDFLHLSNSKVLKIKRRSDGHELYWLRSVSEMFLLFRFNNVATFTDVLNDKLPVHIKIVFGIMATSHSPGDGFIVMLDVTSQRKKKRCYAGWLSQTIAGCAYAR